MPARLFRSERTVDDLTVILAVSCVMCGGHSTGSAAKDVCTPGQSTACTVPAVGSECALCDGGLLDSARESLTDASTVEAPSTDVMSEDVGAITYGDAGICATCGPALCPIGQGFIGSPSECMDLSPSMMLCLTILS